MGEGFVVSIQEAGLMALNALPHEDGAALADYWAITNEKPKSGEEVTNILTDSHEQYVLALVDPSTYLSFLAWLSLTSRSFCNTDGSQTGGHLASFVRSIPK